MAKPGKQGLQRIVDATGYSFKGLQAAWRHEAAFRQEVMVVVVLVPLAFWLGRTAMEQALLLLTCFIVLIAELVNSAIEAVVDRVGDEYHPLAGRAKDIGSAVVFMALLMTGVVWLLIAYERFLG